MLQVICVEDINQESLLPYRTLRQPEENFKKGIVVAEGEKVVARLLQSSFTILSCLMTPEWLKGYESQLQKRKELIPVYIAQKEMLEKIVGFHLHQGIMALARVPAILTFEELVESARPPHLLVALDGLTNAENIGIIVRNAAAFGVHGIIVGETSCSPYLRRAVRNSMGAIFQLPVYHSEELATTLRCLKEDCGFSLIAAHPHAHDVLYETRFPPNICLVFGSEGDGISEKVLGICDKHVALPMFNNVDSLNVANATAVFLYEVYRQRFKQ